MPRNPEVNYYLKPVGDDGKALIFLNYKYSNNRLFYSSLNDLLESLKQICENAYKSEKVKGIPNTTTLKEHLTAFLNVI